LKILRSGLSAGGVVVVVVGGARGACVGAVVGVEAGFDAGEQAEAGQIGFDVQHQVQEVVDGGGRVAARGDEAGSAQDVFQLLRVAWTGVAWDKVCRQFARDHGGAFTPQRGNADATDLEHFGGRIDAGQGMQQVLQTDFGRAVGQSYIVGMVHAGEDNFVNPYRPRRVGAAGAFVNGRWRG
jgi:hypothetical protein